MSSYPHKYINGRTFPRRSPQLTRTLPQFTTIYPNHVGVFEDIISSRLIYPYKKKTQTYIK